MLANVRVVKTVALSAYVCVNTTAEGTLAIWFDVVVAAEEREGVDVGVEVGEREDVVGVMLKIMERIPLTPKVVVTEIETPENFDDADEVAVMLLLAVSPI